MNCTYNCVDAMCLAGRLLRYASYLPIFYELINNYVPFRLFKTNRADRFLYSLFPSRRIHTIICRVWTHWTLKNSIYTFNMNLFQYYILFSQPKSYSKFYKSLINSGMPFFHSKASTVVVVSSNISSELNECFILFSD